MNRFIYSLSILFVSEVASGILYAASSDSFSASLSTSTISISTATEAAPHTSTHKPVHALHVTSWMAGSKKYREHFNELLRTTVVNAIVIDVKEFEGEVYVPGVGVAEKAGAYVPAMPDIAAWLADLKKQGIYTVGRIVVFKDNIMPRQKKSWAVKNPQGELWFDRNKVTWLDPYNLEAGRYNLLIALQAAKLGFDEVQFDYIRFPTDGALSQLRFSRPYNKEEAPAALVGFLKQAQQLLQPTGAKISIDVFGLTTSVKTGMGIGQLLVPMTAYADYVCPMTYPSHYAKGEYGIPNPNDEPYKTVHLAMRDAIRALGPDNAQKLRPYLQDFSLKGRGIRYGKKEIRAQMQAAADLGVDSWTLWNARCSYTLDAIRTPVLPAFNSHTIVNLSTDSKTTPDRR